MSDLLGVRAPVRRVKLLLACCGLAIGATAQILADPQVFGRPLVRPILAGADGQWPDLIGRIGPYGGLATFDDIQRMTSDRFDLAVVAGIARDVSMAMRTAGAKYIDTRLWNRLYDVCRRQYEFESSTGQPQACTLSKSDSDAIAAQAASDLRGVESDPALAGYWILDDNPHGDVSGMLATLRNLVRDSNARSGFSRPTICGVGGSLDHKSSVGAANFAPDRQYMVDALRNVSPAGCDLIAPYFYGAASVDDPSLVDWSMGNLLPYFLQAAKARGYDVPSAALIPIAHAFSFHTIGTASYYVKPRADDIVAQMHAYCDAGAKSMLFFTWRSQDAEFSYANDAALRDGVMRGSADCKKLWRAAQRP